MQPARILKEWLGQHADAAHYLFKAQDLRPLCPDLSDAAFKTLLSRLVKAGSLKKICRSLYAYPPAIPSHGLILFHVAAYLRSGAFNYMSLETVLSEAGIISQIPIRRIFIFSSGRSNVISCGEYGAIEFIHTNQKPEALVGQLSYDTRCKLWRASVPLALRDMKRAHRNCDLINEEALREFV